MQYIYIQPIGEPSEGQYNAEVLIAGIAEKMPADAEKLICVVDVDLFVPGLNFVFGLASGNTACRYT